jgi:hypothetical protein
VEFAREIRHDIKGLATKAEAENWFSVWPSTAANVILLAAGAAAS